MGKKIGIDLGTTFTLASFINDGGKPELIPNAEGLFLTRSVIWAKDGQIEVGETAMNLAEAEPSFLVAEMKRNMGDDSYRFQGMTATDAACHLLKKVKLDAESFFNGEEVQEAAITVPAYFTDAPLKATKLAGEMAGLKVTALPKEPTAAALYYGTAQLGSGDKLLVCDIGGGTTDATVLEYSASGGRSEFSVLSSDGSRDLGGEDWTAALVDLVAPSFEREFGVALRSDRHMERGLIDSCERAKRALTVGDVARVVMAFRGKAFSVPVTRAEFEGATEALLEQALMKAQSALDKSGLDWSGVSRVLLVGGATRMKMVPRGLKEMSGKDPVAWGVADHLVALGAALYTGRRVAADGGVELVLAGAGAGCEIVVGLREATTHGLGAVVAARSPSGPRLVSSVIIRPQTAVPARGSRSDYETQPHQTELDVPVVQADRDGLDAAACVVNKTYRFRGVPDRGAPSQVRVTFSYDRDNMIDVEAVDCLTGKALRKSVIDFDLPARGALDGVTVALLLDTSISMGGEPLSQLKTEVSSVCGALQETGCRVGVVEFGFRVAVVCAPTGDFDTVRDAVDRLRAGGSTPMAEGIASVAAVMSEIVGERIAVLVSDGMPNSQTDARQRADELKELGVTLYTISIGTAGADFLRSIGDSYTQIQSVGGLANAIGNLLWSR